MFAFFTQLFDWVLYKRPHLFPLFFTWVWSIWLSKMVPARWYRVALGEYSGTTSIIIPVVDESEELFRKVLSNIVKQNPTEIFVIANGIRSPRIEEVCKEFVDVRYRFTPVAGKRTAVKTGLEEATGQITVLVDSDTLWVDNTLSELLKPFSNPKVGGVTTHQKIFNPNRTFFTRFANWMEESRSSTSMPAQSVTGKVGCLPGRTIAFRTSILKKVMPLFLNDIFLGVHLEVSDDRTLTNYTLKMGYNTVYQRSSVVYTDAPEKVMPFIKQQYRWARGSQYNTLRMLPWYARHAPLTGLHFLSDVLTPFLVFLMSVHMVKSVFFPKKTGTYLLNSKKLASWKIQIPMAIVGACISAGTRNAAYLKNNRSDLPMLPVYAVLLTVLMTPIRIWGFLTCAWDASWGTRANSYTGTKNTNPKQYIPFLVGLVKLALALWAALRSP